MTDCKPPHWNYIFITSHLGDMILNYAKAYALLKVRLYVATFLSLRQIMAWYATLVAWSLKIDNTIHAHEKGRKTLHTCNVDKLHISLEEEASLLPSWWGGQDDDIIIMESPLGFPSWWGGMLLSWWGGFPPSLLMRRSTWWHHHHGVGLKVSPWWWGRLPSWWGGRHDDIIILESAFGFSTWWGGRFPSSMGCPPPWWGGMLPSSMGYPPLWWGVSVRKK